MSPLYSPALIFGISTLCVPALIPSLASSGAASGYAELSTPLAALRSETLAADALPNVVIQSTGAIQADVDAFREILGNPNNNAAVGQQLAGHREVNWDGVPAALSNVFHFPHDFFNVNSPRGLVYDSTLRGLEVSSHAFTEINQTYGTEFVPFSGAKLFSPLGTNVSDITFRVAGSGVDAGVRGFGIVFLDVDVSGSTGIELYGADGEILAAVRAPVRSDDRGASFVGVAFRDPIVTRVRIVAGNARLLPSENDISRGGLHDIVVMDDFIYGEPTAVQ